MKSASIRSEKMADMQDISTLPQPATSLSATEIKVKAPKRILHFSDGTMEEYSTDEEDTPDAKANDKQISVVCPVVHYPLSVIDWIRLGHAH